MEQIETDLAPAAVGPYSQALTSGSMIFCSGQIGIDPETGALVEGGIKNQIRQVFSNVREVLGAAGLKLDSVIKTTLFLADMEDFPLVNRIYAEEFGPHKPARSTVQVTRLPMHASVEMECIAVREE